MNKVLLRWILPTAAVLILGPLAAIPVATLRGTDGSPDTTLLVSASPVMGVISLLIVAVVAGAGAAITESLLNLGLESLQPDDAFRARRAAAGTARTFAGLVVAWAAMRTGASWNIFMVHGGSVVTPLVIEGVLVAIAGAGLLVVLATFDGTRDATALREDFTAAVSGKNALVGLVVGIVAGGVGAFLVAVEGGRGQCMMAGALGSVLAAVGVQLAESDLSPERARLRASIAVLVLMVLSPASLLFFPGAGHIADAARTGSLVGPGLVQPLDWLVGVFLGVPTGMAWVGSVAEKAHHQHTAKTVKP
ncbi:MAG: hypothetical protein H6810_01425 [Phycisphaeraceae bacterium]|nr:MAG: hypothetical protein H6810_01425 [Phycisphaeraceae bacterium]